MHQSDASAPQSFERRPSAWDGSGVPEGFLNGTSKRARARSAWLGKRKRYRQALAEHEARKKDRRARRLQKRMARNEVAKGFAEIAHGMKGGYFVKARQHGVLFNTKTVVYDGEGSGASGPGSGHAAFTSAKSANIEKEEVENEMMDEGTYDDEAAARKKGEEMSSTDSDFGISSDDF
jgi:hypothetical protein